MKLPSLDPRGDSPPPHPEVEQLTATDHPMLSPRQLGDVLL